jgi:dihydroneopterin triphosphate diphosphatase
MVRIVSDMVDAYVFRKVNALPQFLLFRRRADLPFGGTWHSVHSKILGTETALQTAERAVRERTGLTPKESFSADYVNQFYDSTTDNLILAPVFAFSVESRARIHLSDEYVDFAWCDREEATARLLWAGQREAIRHIDEIIAQGDEESAFYRVSS